MLERQSQNNMYSDALTFLTFAIV